MAILKKKLLKIIDIIKSLINKNKIGKYSTS
jgi:hypothetical protein